MSDTTTVERVDVTRAPDIDKRFPMGWGGKERRTATIGWRLREHAEGGFVRVDLHIHDYADSRYYGALLANVHEHEQIAGGLYGESYEPMRSLVLIREPRARYSRKAFVAFIDHTLGYLRASAAGANGDAAQAAIEPFLLGEHLPGATRALPVAV